MSRTKIIKRDYRLHEQNIDDIISLRSKIKKEAF